MSRSILERQLVTETGTPIVSAAVKRPDGSVITSYDEAHDLVFERMMVSPTPLRPIVGVRNSSERFDFSRVSTVVSPTRSDGLTIHREGDWDRRRLLAIISRPGIGEWDAT